MDIAVVVVVVVVLTQLLKVAFLIPSRFIPLVALAIGAVFYALAYFTGSVTLDFKTIMDVLVGILSAMGLYSGAKAVAGK